jgi:hypothetical protein
MFIRSPVFPEGATGAFLLPRHAGDRGSRVAARGESWATFVFFVCLGFGEGRENRPQLRCGIVPQTPTASANGVGKANRVSSPVKARSEV